MERLPSLFSTSIVLKELTYILCVGAICKGEIKTPIVGWMEHNWKFTQRKKSLSYSFASWILPPFVLQDTDNALS